MLKKLKDAVLVQDCELAAEQSCFAQLESPPKTVAMAASYNRIGGLLAVLAAQAGIAVEAALAVWSVESGPFDFLPGRPVLRQG